MVEYLGVQELIRVLSRSGDVCGSEKVLWAWESFEMVFGCPEISPLLLSLIGVPRLTKSYVEGAKTYGCPVISGGCPVISGWRVAAWAGLMALTR